MDYTRVAEHVEKNIGTQQLVLGDLVVGGESLELPTFWV